LLQINENAKEGKENMKKIFGVLLIVLGIVGGLYVGGWLMFVKSILTACNAFDEGTLTGSLVAVTIIKCVFASSVGGVIAYIGYVLGTLLRDN
jgi:hypothetical protein